MPKTKTKNFVTHMIPVESFGCQIKEAKHFLDCECTPEEQYNDIIPLTETNIRKWYNTYAFSLNFANIVSLRYSNLYKTPNLNYDTIIGSYDDFDLLNQPYQRNTKDFKRCLNLLISRLRENGIIE